MPHRGHYCKVCGEYKANEKFSGRGHAAHICKVCAALPPEQQAEATTINRLFALPWRLSKADMTWLKNRAKDKRPAVRELAQEQLAARFPSARQAQLERNTDMDTNAFEHEELEHLLISLTEQTKLGAIRWECTEYNPISLYDDSDLVEGRKRIILTQMFSLETEINGNPVCVEMDESIDISTGKGDIGATITADVDTGYRQHETALSYDLQRYDDCSAEQLKGIYGASPLAQFADAVVQTLAASVETEAGFMYARFVNQKGIPAKTLELPLCRLGKQLMEEKRAGDFHRMVLDTEYRGTLLAAMSD
ncbi:MAG: hypothetical protein PHE09_03425 [Oscillospiraceae bacterium]|nr:hypothetical protein [Oscillospiraceae bacterium]